MSPYIFIFCIQVLTAFINKKVDSRSWSPVRIRDTSISHLLYADDVLLFAKVKNKSIRAINSFLNSFMSFSSLNINFSKSLVWSSPNTPSHIRTSSSSSLGIREVSKPGSYLGIPLGITGRTSDFNNIVEMIQNRVND